MMLAQLRTTVAMDLSRRYENTLVAILFFTWGTVFLDRMSQMYLAPYFAPEFHLSHEQVGSLASVLAVTWAASTFFFGALSDRIGRKPVLVPAVFAFSLLSWMSGMAHSYHELLWIRALMGIAEGPTWSIMTALIEESSPPTRRGRNIGLVVSAAALVGLAAAPVLTTQVAARWGWRSAFLVAGIPGLLMGSLIWKLVREPAADGATSHRKPKLIEYLAILRYRNIWLCCLGAAGFMSWLFALNVFAPLYITEVAHESPTTAGFLLGASGLGSFFLGFLLPSLSDRIGRKPVLLLMAAMSAVVPLGFPRTCVVCLSLRAGSHSVCCEYWAGNREFDHGAGADRERAPGIPRYLHRAGNTSRRNYGRDHGPNPGGHAGRKTWACLDHVVGGRRKRHALCSDALSEGNRRLTSWDRCQPTCQQGSRSGVTAQSLRPESRRGPVVGGVPANLAHRVQEGENHTGRLILSPRHVHLNFGVGLIQPYRG